MARPLVAAYLLDLNVWVALVIPTHLHHAVAEPWFDALETPDQALFCQPTQQGVLRLLSTESVMRAYGQPVSTNDEAWALLDLVMADSRVGVAAESNGLLTLWRRFSSPPSASPKLWMDAYLAAFAVSGGYTFVTIDRAFRQFNGLDVLILGD